MGLGKFKEFELQNNIVGAVSLKLVQKVKKTDKKFLKGPIQWSWLIKAANLSGKILHVAIALFFISGLTKTNKIKMQSARLKELGISRHAYSRALKELEDAHLVEVERKPGQTPTVTILDI